MAHMLEQYGDMASFASLREPAWHGLGTEGSNPLGAGMGECPEWQRGRTVNPPVEPVAYLE